MGRNQFLNFLVRNILTIVLLFVFITACSNQDQPNDETSSPSDVESAPAELPQPPPTPNTGGAPESIQIYGYEGVGFNYSADLFLNANGTKLPAFIEFMPFYSGEGQIRENMPDFTEIALETDTGLARIGVQPIRTGTGQFFPTYDHLDIQRFGTIDHDVRNQAGAVEMGIIPLKLSYHTFKNGNGRSFLTFAPTTNPQANLTNDRLTYIFEGVSDDGQHLVWVEFPVSTTLLDTLDPATPAQTILDQLDDLPAEVFSPDLAKLDSLVASFQLSPVESFHNTFSTEATDPGKIVVTFGETAVSAPPDVYAINLTTDQYYDSPLSMSTESNTVEFSVPPGNYQVYAHSTATNDDTFYGYWRPDNIGLQIFSVLSDQTVSTPILTVPYDPCFQTVPASPDNKYEATDGE
ncbi:MAG: hypothetical protein GY943_13225, partial [Chloroflexi bacterium]|nr:hypothetical protein [Chloroflexota bacterium]